MATIINNNNNTDDDDDDGVEDAAEDAEEKKDGHIQLGASSCEAAGHAQPQPAPAPASSPLQSHSLALVPFTGIPLLCAKPDMEAAAAAAALIKGPAREAAQAALRDLCIAGDGVLSVARGLDRAPAKSCEGKEHKKRSKNWSRAETLTLISLRTDLAPRFAKAVRKVDLWDEIAQAMQKGPFSRDAQQCRDKWEKLIAGYKEVRDGVKQKEDNPYFDDLHPLLSGRVSKREREPNEQQHSAKAEDFKKPVPVVVGDAARPAPTLPSQHQQLHPVWNVAHHHHHTALKGLSMDGRFPAPLDRLPFSSSIAEPHLSRPAAIDSRTVSAEDNGDDDGDGASAGKRRKGSKLLSLTDLRAFQGLLESMLTKQQVFFKELLEGIEKKEELREQRRWEREEKWRAEERAQHLFFAETLQILIQRLGPHNNMSAAEAPSLGVATPGPADCMPPACSPAAADANLTLKKRSKNWKRSEVLQLIKLRAEMEDKFAKSIRRAALWVELSELLSIEGVTRDGKQCREKWDKLMSEYKDVVDGKKATGDSPYFPELHAALARGGLGLDNQRVVDVPGASSDVNVVHT